MSFLDSQLPKLPLHHERPRPELQLQSPPPTEGHPETAGSGHTQLSTARAEQTFWTPLTIQYGVTVSHNSDVKCCVKAEVMGCNVSTLGRDPEHPKPRVWTLR